MSNHHMTFLTADTRELVLLRDFDTQDMPLQNVFYLRPGKLPIQIKMQADANPEESLWYWFLNENYPQFLEDSTVAKEQLRQVAYLILDGIYIEEKSTARKFLIVDGLQNIFRNFSFIGKIHSDAAISCLVQSGEYVKKMFRDFYPVTKPVKLSFDPTTDYDVCGESEIVYLSHYDDSQEEGEMGGLFQYCGYDEEEDDDFYNRQKINGEDEEDDNSSGGSSPYDGFFEDGE